MDVTTALERADARAAFLSTYGDLEGTPAKWRWTKMTPQAVERLWGLLSVVVGDTSHLTTSVHEVEREHTQPKWFHRKETVTITEEWAFEVRNGERLVLTIPRIWADSVRDAEVIFDFHCWAFRDGRKRGIAEGLAEVIELLRA